MIRGIFSIWDKKPKQVITIWLISSLILAATGFLLGMKTVIPGPASYQALLENPGEKLAIDAGLPRKDFLLVILSSYKFNSESREFTIVKDALYQKLKQYNYSDSGELIFKSIETSGHSLLSDSYYNSEDGLSSLFIAKTNIEVNKSNQILKYLPDMFKEWNKDFPDFKINYLSEGTANNEIFELINSDLDRSLLYTIPITFLILVWAFGSIYAALLPIFMAIISLISSLGVAAIFSNIFGAISATASQLVVLLVLAVGVDYSLFIVSRVREEVQKGSNYPDAIAIARRSAGNAVFWSGLTVALSLLGLFLMNDTILMSMATVSIIAVFLTVLGTLATLPSMLLLSDNKLEFGNLFKRKAVNYNSILNRSLSFSLNYPLASLSLGLIIILSISYFSLGMKLGTTVEAKMLPAMLQTSKAFSLLQNKYPNLAGTDLSLIINFVAPEKYEDNTGIEDLMDKLALHDNLEGPLKIETNKNQTVARYHFIAKGSANQKANRDLVRILEDDYLPNNIINRGNQAYLAGTLSFVVKEIERYKSRTPIVFGVVLILSFIFLLAAFRSLVVPLKAIFLNILSTTASFGILVLVFQSGLIGSCDYGVIETFVPPLLFSILFGLSMDYHVFLLSRIREESLKGVEIRQAVKNGIMLTSSTITSAALIMITVFAVIASLKLPLMKELGVGLAAAILIDATIIRSVLLPSSMILLGSLNWYLPKWMAKLPTFTIES